MRSEAPSRPRHGIATILQDLQSDLSGQRLARCDHAVAGTSGRKNCPERTGLLLGTERHWSDCGERQNGGTSFAAPIVAGIQALINQKMKGEAQGNPNYVYYKLAAKEYGANGSPVCNSSNGQNIAPSCAFNDVTQGDNDMDCANAVDCYRPSGAVGVESQSIYTYMPTYKAKVGYDFATGIGTINAANLVSNWETCLH
jgi:hypothetical protein